jgi:nucleotide-binding universal stress UspA family protein
VSTAPVLVGVDGSAASLAAVDLAKQEAALRGRAVRVVHADTWANHPAWVDSYPSGESADDLPAEPWQTVHTATERAGGGAVPVTGEVLAGDPATVLIRESAGAELVVLGHRGRGGFPELLLGSVAVKVAAHAACPVLVTRGEASAGGEILLGVDGSPPDRGVVEFALREATLRGAGLLALHAWIGPELTGPTDMVLYDPQAEREEQELMLTGALSKWSAEYPSVPIRDQLVIDRPAHALVAASGHVQLIVLGARAGGILPGKRLGSVSHAVMHHSACPVAIVHPAR